MRTTARWTTVIAAACGLASASAGATMLQLAGGVWDITSPHVPGNVTAGNDVITPPVNFWDNATITATQDIQLTFYYLGAESGYGNTLHVTGPGGGSHTDDNTYPANWSNPALFTIYVAAGQAVPMFFDSTGPNFPVAPGGANLVSGVFDRSIGFSILECAPGSLAWATSACFASSSSVTAGAIVAFMLDDGGAVPNDDNHDDYVGYMVATQVPLPAGAWLLGSGLCALWAARRRQPNRAG